MLGAQPRARSSAPARSPSSCARRIGGLAQHELDQLRARGERGEPEAAAGRGRQCARDRPAGASAPAAASAVGPNREQAVTPALRDQDVVVHRAGAEGDMRDRAASSRAAPVSDRARPDRPLAPRLHQIVRPVLAGLLRRAVGHRERLPWPTHGAERGSPRCKASTRPHRRPASRPSAGRRADAVTSSPSRATRRGDRTRGQAAERGDRRRRSAASRLGCRSPVGAANHARAVGDQNASVRRRARSSGVVELGDDLGILQRSGWASARRRSIGTVIGRLATAQKPVAEARSARRSCGLAPAPVVLDEVRIGVRELVAADAVVVGCRRYRGSRLCSRIEVIIGWLTPARSQ